MLKTFSPKLLSWYKKNKRDLPWRKTRDPYKIWISEIMLQQTTVKAVIPYYKNWIETFPTIDDVARAPLQKILKTWQGLGYYQRARNIHACAKMICTEFDGKVPSREEDLKMLPGFGPYTRGAVLSIAFDKRFSIIDANVRRVMMRLMGIRGEANQKHDEKIRNRLDEIMPAKNVGDFNQALMELGAMICRSQEPVCTICPVKGFCVASKRGIQELIPTPVKSNIKTIDVVIAIFYQNKRFYIQQRASRGLFADFWEFPGGKVEKRESQKEALCREMKEELGVEIRPKRHLLDLTHFYTSFKCRLHVWMADLLEAPPLDKRHRWVTLKSFSTYPLPSGSVRILEYLQTKKFLDNEG